MKNIMWFIKNDMPLMASSQEYTSSYNHHLGNFDSSVDNSIEIIVWHNYYGQNDVGEIPNAKLVVKTTTLDSAYLLDYIDVYVGAGEVPVSAKTYFGDMGFSIDLGTMYGFANTAPIATPHENSKHIKGIY